MAIINAASASVDSYPRHSFSCYNERQRSLCVHFTGAGGEGKEFQTMAKAIWNGETIAESDVFEIVEGNIYFPPESVNREFTRPSATSSHCPWKGDASYLTLVVNGEENADAAWCYPDPFEKAQHIKDHVAFWKGVMVERCQA